MKIFRFTKKVFFTGLTTLSSLTNVNSLSCISMSNQPCKARPEIVNVNSNNPIFYPFSIKTSKCSGSCNNINDPYSKICVPDIVKNLNVKVFNLMSRTNEARHIKLHETCKCECRLDAIVCNNKQRWNNDKCRCECKKFIDKGVCDKGFIWNASNCECECDKSCDIGEYLDYKSCKCRKRLIDELVDECTKTVKEVKPTIITLAENENSYKCSVLFWIFFTINVNGIGTDFVYFYWYLKKDSPYVDFNTHKETTIY